VYVSAVEKVNPVVDDAGVADRDARRLRFDVDLRECGSWPRREDIDPGKYWLLGGGKVGKTCSAIQTRIHGLPAAGGTDSDRLAYGGSGWWLVPPREGVSTLQLSDAGCRNVGRGSSHRESTSHRLPDPRTRGGCR